MLIFFTPIYRLNAANSFPVDFALFLFFHYIQVGRCSFLFEDNFLFEDLNMWMPQKCSSFFKS